MESAAGLILVVDDEPNNTDMLKRRLERASYQVDAVGSGKEALEHLERKVYDAVLLDFMMPEMDGPEVLRRLRAAPKESNTPVIMVTAKTDSEDISSALNGGADDYVTKPVDFKVLLSRLQAQVTKRRSRQSLENLNTSLNQEVAQGTSHLSAALGLMETVAENIQAVIWSGAVSQEGDFRFTALNGLVEEILGVPRETLIGDAGAFYGLVRSAEGEQFEEQFKELLSEEGPVTLEIRIHTPKGVDRWVLLGARVRRAEETRIDGVFLDTTEKKALETQLLQNQKLEAVGQLASGIAHEINSPAQFTRDNIGFLQDSFKDLMRFMDLQKEVVLECITASSLSEERVTGLKKLSDEIDLDYLVGEIPAALEQSISGIERISEIVTAMKGFTHPGGEEAQGCDLNKLVEDTTVVARNEWKYLATLKLELDTSLPDVKCFPSELCQVVLNLIVNAAHAIEEQNKSSGQLGEIHVSTCLNEQDQRYEIRITDNGPGVPDELKNRIFDPFFTTKVVGKGTGQGLAIARSVVVDKHRGDLTIETTGPEGTVFLISIPVDL